ncbi:Nucleotide-binding alpha-beta plait [Penicillium macrosclerotiorum]|uniref:Nucleotide-binding alpha-beta plait n=1 Tax=Penicillium macrosclerotiorum TaxID=303699 RepID=UPI002546D2E9|nr:Nucleotide-binding alpha-beta plait [Penicillium macrosclerotiorum]KAJ5688580.1 Nucleotide-binding alpha-beta plait [Penicillium macrosclerotiorum]
MPLLGREKGRSQRSRRSDDEFVVFLQGIPAHCRWQELKDLVRQTALHIRQAVVYDDSHGFPTGLGQIIVKNEDEAWRTYHRLSTNGWEGQSLVVTLARTSAPTKPIAGPTRSPPAMMQGYMSGLSTPPRSQGNMNMPPSPISPEAVHPTSPTYPYPEYTPMMGPMTIPPQPFIPMMPDPMQCFPPSPMMHGSMYDAQAWNMMPMYPISPIQPVHDHGTDGFPRYHPRKPWAHHLHSSSPSPDMTPRAVYIQNLNSATTTADLKSLLQGAGSVEQCNVTVTSEAHDNEAQTHGSAIMHSAEEAERAVTMLNGMTFMGSRIRVKMDRRLNMMRSGSWDGAMAMQEEYDPTEPAASEKGSECSGCGQDIPAKRAADPNRPLVVDGSGMQKKSLELLSTSAPT